mmetsp:Transcript_79871/g.166057  ORF Transcript_79871/g.166057 Transcript_79871/m.166057 type:complete len:297 (+) Transcript_79871:198-1088(+)
MASDSLRLKGVSFDGRKGFATLSFESLRGAGNLEAGLLRAIEHCESNTKKVHALLLIFPENRTVMSAQTCDEQELVLDRVLIQRLLALRPLLIGFAERSTSVLETCLLACCDLAYGLETAAFQASSSSSAGAASNESPETTASQLHTGNAATATATATAAASAGAGEGAGAGAGAGADAGASGDNPAFATFSTESLLPVATTSSEASPVTATAADCASLLISFFSEDFFVMRRVGPSTVGASPAGSSFVLIDLRFTSSCLAAFTGGVSIFASCLTMLRFCCLGSCDVFFVCDSVCS